jgi:hypothetical protein
MSYSISAIMLLLMLNMVFFMGLMSIDYSMTFKGTGAYAQSLLFEHVDIGTLYHTGIVSLIATHLGLCFLFAIVLKRVKR